MKKALLIGINDYPKGYELKGCVNDVKTLKLLLERNGDSSKNFDVKVLLDVKTSQEAMKSIEQLFSGNEECALLYFSGHGFINTVGGELVFPDGCAIDKYYKGLQMSNIMSIINKSKVKNKIVILDCCHAGNIAEKTETTNSELGEGVSILTACRKDETALEMGGHGVFTELLCDALQGGAADFSGNITVGGIYAYIDRSFGCWEQRPIFKTNVSEFTPLRTIKPKVDNEEIRKITDLFSNPKNLLELDPSFEDTNTLEVKHLIIKPYADEDNVKKFKILQKLQSIGFIEPVGEEFMYFAAMKSKSCRLTVLGQYYWKLVKNNRI
nr:caspase family protein [uncultured Capnocytophaga sp.]